MDHIFLVRLAGNIVIENTRRDNNLTTCSGKGIFVNVAINIKHSDIRSGRVAWNQSAETYYVTAGIPGKRI
jgi:hypothetical protein